MAATSVLVPTCNTPRYLEAALRSALDQMPSPVEVLVQDGGTDEETPSTIAAIGDSRIHYVRERDQGQSDALNRAIRRSKGEWLAFLNADDVFAPGIFAATDPGADIVYGDFDYIDEDGHALRHFAPGPVFSRERLLAEGCYVFPGAALFRRSLFARHGGLDPGLRLAMDYELYIRVAPHVRARYVPQTLGAFRVHRSSRTSGITWRLVRETAAIRRRYGGYGPATRRPVLVNQAKQVVDVLTAPARRRLRLP